MPKIILDNTGLYIGKYRTCLWKIQDLKILNDMDYTVLDFGKYRS